MMRLPSCKVFPWYRFTSPFKTEMRDRRTPHVDGSNMDGMNGEVHDPPPFRFSQLSTKA